MSDKHDLKIMMVAGEVSGDLQGGMLAQAIKELAPNAILFGMGGQKMKDAGVDIRFDVLRHASIGIWENAKNYFLTVRAVFNRMKKVIEEEKPSCIVLIDYQGFNLELAKFAKNKGIRLVYYIPPQYWAWRTGQAKYVSRLIDQIIAILPEEEEAYRKAGANVTFVGSPLLERVRVSGTREELRDALGVRRESKLIALLPGSRFSEVRRLLPVMLEAVKILRARMTDTEFIVPVAASHLKEEIEKQISRSGLPVRAEEGRTYEILKASNFAVVCSGLATLEAAMLGTPMAVVYRVSFLTSLIMRMLIQIPNISPPNILAGRAIVPELLQERANARNVADTVCNIMMDPNVVSEMKKNLSEAVSRLGSPGASRRAAEIVLKVAGSL